MADQQEPAGSVDSFYHVPVAEEPKTSPSTVVPTVDMLAKDEMAVGEVTDPCHDAISTNLTPPVSHTASVTVSENFDMPQKSERKGIFDPGEAATSENVKYPALETGSEETPVKDTIPAQAIDHPTSDASFKAPTPTNHIPTEPTMVTSSSAAQQEPQVTVHSSDHDLHSKDSESATHAPSNESLPADEQFSQEGPELSSLPTEHGLTPHGNGSAVQTHPVPTVNAEPEVAPIQSETTTPPVTDTASAGDPAPASHEPLELPAEADTFMGQAEPVLEALAKCKATLTQDPAAAIVAINDAASGLDHIMEQHGLNTNYEVQTASFKEDMDPLAHVNHEAVSGSHDIIQQHDHAVPQPPDVIPPADPQSLTAHALPPETHASPETHAPLGMHEPLRANPAAETLADFPSADEDMDDGSSSSTIHAHLGAHAPSVGTDSVNGDSSMGDGDSALGDDVESITESLSASMLEYRYENGRRYHAFEDGKYHLPNDEKEADRLDFQHHIWLLTLNGELHRAPLPSTIQNVLDVGTGTGIWAIDFANAYPNARVIGTDLSPIQPSWVPPNLSFMVDDAEALQDWEFTQQFDYIHSRLVVLSMRNWPRYLKRCYDNLRPGGWIELQEVQFPFAYDEDFPPNDSPLLKWSGYVTEATSRVGVDTQAATKFVDMLQNEGFININKEEIRWPIGSWSKDPKEKEIGKWMVYNALEGVESAGMALFSRVFGWSKDEIFVFLERVRKDIRNKNAHYYTRISVHYAQKPFESGGID